MPDTFDYDLFVIGAGSGGVRAARIAASLGAKVAVAEEYRAGGTCVIRGCVPKKFMVYASEYRDAFEHARGYGWRGEAPVHDWAAMLRNIHAEVDRLSGIYVRLLENAGCDYFEARAELAGPSRVRLSTGREVTARKILIATGGRPWRPMDLEGQELAITSNEIFHLPGLPERVVIGGGGYIACEFASILAGLGAEVCQVYRGDTVLRGWDWDIRTEIHEGLKRRGVRVITHAVFSKLEKTAGGIRVSCDNGEVIEASHVMFAIGREPYTEGLGLESAGVETLANGAIKVDDYSRTSNPDIYAVGDVTDRLNLTPVAIREGAAAAHTMFGAGPQKFDHADIASAVFTTPPGGSVGLSEADARRRFPNAIDIYKTRFRPMKHIITGDEQRVLMKLVVHAETDRVLGVHIVGEEAGELIQLAGIAVKAGLTKAQFDDTCAVHPTISEELVTIREKYVDPTLKAAE